MKKIINLRNIIGNYDPKYPALDESTPWYNFNSYLICCESLNVKPSLTRFIKYNEYYKNYGEKST